VQELQKHIVNLESRQEIKQDLPKPSAPQSEGVASQAAASQQQTITTDDRNVLDFVRGATINLGADGYNGYNLNRPVGRVNLLRAYDVTHNSFRIEPEECGQPATANDRKFADGFLMRNGAEIIRTNHSS
jgi:hypothetical protein